MDLLPTMLYAVGCTTLLTAFLLGAYVLLTPKKGFEAVDTMMAVKCNNCGRVQLQKKNMACVQCGNIEQRGD